ncbi:recombination regulator RecX [Photobacterium sanctipauli]|uniref:Regulatory protein RecX n=2 Tax=Photobacterium sanctipauli TaxID=1342794 RepID=A0A2T3NQT0_9GAMM|nr:regulatory protein RecX [Photobacterium sanctipauli]PSW18636.1 recombination regulator RecX [Photobacterium sanctipauli]
MPRPKKSAKAAAVAYLSRRDHAEKELQQKLVARGYDEQEAQEAVAFCQDYNWIDDARYAERTLSNGIAKGWGLLRIRQELAYKGIHEAIVQQLLEEDEFDWFGHAKAVALRKFGATEIDTPKEKARRFRFLQSRGFELEEIRYALNIDDEY